MRLNVATPFILFTLLAGTLLGAAPQVNKREVPLSAYKRAQISVKGKSIKVYVADTVQKQRVGLMFVAKTQMGVDEGMVFVFPDVQYRAFWMKDTVMPLDICFVRSDGRIINILAAKPMDMSSYPSDSPAKYVVEMHVGWFRKRGIKPGDKFDFRGLSRAK
jgi:uncharacterized membrane protein (UPF0127 family)